METVIIFSSSSFCFFIVMAVFANKIYIAKTQDRVSRSLGRADISLDLKKDTKKPKKQIIKHLVHKSLNLFSSPQKEKKKDPKNSKLLSAGLNDWTTIEWNTLCYTLALLSMASVIIISSFLEFSLIQIIELAFIFFLLGYISPKIWLNSKIKKRKEEIEQALPDVLDLVLVSVEAGLGFDAALMKVVEKQKGILAEEFLQVLQEIKMGRPRREALKDLGDRNNIDDLRNVIASIIQADTLGISMGGVLRNQAKQIRQKRRQKAEEQAQKAPVKIIVPLVFFIFPCIFIVILGPAVIRILTFLING